MTPSGTIKLFSFVNLSSLFTLPKLMCHLKEQLSPKIFTICLQCQRRRLHHDIQNESGGEILSTCKNLLRIKFIVMRISINITARDTVQHISTSYYLYCDEIFQQLASAHVIRAMLHRHWACASRKHRRGRDEILSPLQEPRASLKSCKFPLFELISPSCV